MFVEWNCVFTEMFRNGNNGKTKNKQTETKTKQTKTNP